MASANSPSCSSFCVACDFFSSFIACSVFCFCLVKSTMLEVSAEVLASKSLSIWLLTSLSALSSSVTLRVSASARFRRGSVPFALDGLREVRSGGGRGEEGSGWGGGGQRRRSDCAAACQKRRRSGSCAQ